MNTIHSTSRMVETVDTADRISPTTIKQHEYSVVGGRNREIALPPEAAITLLYCYESGLSDIDRIIQEYKRHDFYEIIISMYRQKGYEVEQLTQKYPEVRFVLFDDSVNSGEIINVCMKEIISDYVFVLNQNFTLPLGIINQRLKEKLIEVDELCVVPYVSIDQGGVIPIVNAPALDRDMCRILNLHPKQNRNITLFPFQYAGIYNRKKFLGTGGYEASISSPYWQKVDFGFRLYMWGHQIPVLSNLKLIIKDCDISEDSSPSGGYQDFYLRNLAPRYNGQVAELPLSRFWRFYRSSGFGLVQSISMFIKYRKWIQVWGCRFERDARTVTELWEAGE